MFQAELLSLHEVSPTNGGIVAQPYVGCIQLQVNNGGNSNPPNLAAFPGAYGYNDPGLTFVLWRDFQNPYPFPGPSVYQVGSGLPATTAAVCHDMWCFDGY